MKQIITLITDFGLKDSFTGVMKGVIYSINPNATVVDINHNIDRHNIQQCAVNIINSYSYFPGRDYSPGGCRPGCRVCKGLQ